MRRLATLAGWKRLATLAGILALVAAAAFAQAQEEAGEDNGFILNLIQERLSAPGRQISISGVSGALSSQARVEQIVVSDDEGPWLRIENAEIDWSRAQLLRGRLNINRLAAERVAYLRQPVPVDAPVADRLPDAEAQPFSLPELPVSVQLEELDIASLAFDESIFGQAADLSIAGSLSLIDGALDTTLAVTRRDDPGGQLNLTAAYSNEGRRLDLDLRLQEPKDGIAASLLNIEGRPPIDLRVSGAGPLDDLDITFGLDAGETQIAAGTAQLRARPEGQGFTLDLGGELAPLVPEQYRGFFEGRSAVAVSGVSKQAGGLLIDRLAIDGAVLNLEGGLETGADGFLRQLDLTGTLGAPEGPPVVLPVPGGTTTLQSGTLDVSFGDADRWTGRFALDRLQAGEIAMEAVTLTMGGLAENLDDPAQRSVTILLEGAATGVSSTDPDVARALGDRIDIVADVAIPPDAPIEARRVEISGNGLSIFTAGTFAGGTYTGRNRVRIADIAPFSGLAGRELGGSVDVSANGSVTPLSGAVDLTLDGAVTDVATGDTRVDGILAGETTLAGRVVRDEAGIRTEGVELANPQVTLTTDGVISSARTDFGFDARLSDLALLDPRLAGALTATGRATGADGPIAVTLDAAVPEGRLMDRALTQAVIGFDGTVDGSDVTGALTGSGRLGDQPLNLSGDISVVGERREVQDLALTVGPDRFTGSVAKTGTEPATGTLALDAPDVAPLAALALVEASGAVDATIELLAENGTQGLDIAAEVTNLVLGETRVTDLTVDARIADALGVPLVNGTVSGNDLTLGGIAIDSLAARADQENQERMAFSARTRLAIGTQAEVAGSLARQPGGFAATLSTLTLRQDDLSARLDGPSTVTLQDGDITLTPLTLDLGTGRLTAEGAVGETYDISLDISDLPLTLADAVQPELGLEGTVNGTARVTGPRAAPDIRFDLAAAEVASTATRDAGLPPIALDATGRTEAGRLDLDATIGSGDGLAAQAQGFVPLGQDAAFDLAVTLQALPLSLLDAIAGNRGLRGDLTGTAAVTGPLADPAVAFTVSGSGLGAQVTADNGIPPLQLEAEGRYAAQTVTLASVTASGAGGIALDASGSVPLTGPGLDISVTGSLPLSLADAALADRDAQASGTVRIDATATGSIAAPQFGGTVTLSDGTIVDPQTNLRLNGVTLDARVSGDAVTIAGLQANVSSGGSLDASGQVGLGQGYPADLDIRINDVRYTDGTFVTTRLSGALALDGPLVGDGGMVSGEIALEETELSVAEGLGSNALAALDQVIHQLPPPRVQQTLDRAEVNEVDPEEPTAPEGGGLGLNVLIRAPNQIFVRGRGLDVELGGELRVQGTVRDIQPVGQFDLRRGRLAILGQRIEFDEGSLQLVGNLNPQVFFVARTESEDVTAIVTVQGRATEPAITFSSQPELPQDEVLSRVIFNRSADELSPFQLAQLAAAAAELAGGGSGPGILSQLRGATGLDDLDVVTEEDGSTAVRAGKYVSDNVYLDVQAGSEGNTRAQINLDINDSVTARGSVTTDGNTTLGIFYERDY